MASDDRTIRRDWNTDESFWRENYRTRPYTDENRDFEHYRPAYKYGYDSADRVGRRRWDEAEPELRSGWDEYEGRGNSTWEQVKDSVRDAWDRVTGNDDEGRTTRR
jgi:hypothetical protein